jgi:putative spermidine/putrescine transport system substrate-binding protein
MGRRALLKRLGISAAGILCSSGSVIHGQTQKFLKVWGTITMDIGAGWERLAKERGIKILFEDNKNEPGPVVQKLVDGEEADWRHISSLQGGAEGELALHNAIIPWDISLLKNYDKLWPNAREIPYTYVKGQCYGIPTVINADSMIYRPDLAGAVESYEAIFDPLLKGKTAMEDSWTNSVILTAIYLKEKGIKINKPNDLTETELRDVMGFLNDKAQAGQFCKLWSSPTEAADLFVSGEVYVMMGWEPIVIEARSRGVKVEYAEPREGFEGWSNDLLLHPGARKEGVLEMAYALADWELGGYYGCMIAHQRRYAVPTKLAVNYAEEHPQEFDPKEIKGIIDGVRRKFSAMKPANWQNVMPGNKKLYEEEWAKFRTNVNRARSRKRT